MASSRKITLLSSDGESFEVDQSVAEDSPVIKHVIEDCGNDKPIPLPNVNSKILAKVIEYCKMHEYLKAWDAEFVKVDGDTLCELINAADYLDIKNLLDLTRQTVADIKGKIPEEICKTFIIRNDFTPEEEEEVRRASE